MCDMCREARGLPAYPSDREKLDKMKEQRDFWCAEVDRVNEENERLKGLVRHLETIADETGVELDRHADMAKETFADLQSRLFGAEHDVAVLEERLSAAEEATDIVMKWFKDADAKRVRAEAVVEAAKKTGGPELRKLARQCEEGR